MKNSGRFFNMRRIIFNARSLLQHKSNFSMTKIWLEPRICVLFSYLTSLIALTACYFTCRTTKNREKWPFCRKRPGKFIRSVDTIFLCPESDSALNFESETLRSEAILWNLGNFGNPTPQTLHLQKPDLKSTHAVTSLTTDFLVLWWQLHRRTSTRVGPR